MPFSDVAGNLPDHAAHLDDAYPPADDVPVRPGDAAIGSDDLAVRSDDVRSDDAAVQLSEDATKADTRTDQLTCEKRALGGIGIPAGTVPSASASYVTTLPIHAIDGDLTTSWNPGSNSGWLRLEFPAPTYFTGVRLLAMATPSTNVSYTLSADLLTSPIGSATRGVYSGAAGTILDPIAVTPGTYSSLTITINSGPSWAQLGEVSLVTPTCP